MGFIQGVIKSFIFGGIGMFIAGPIGLIIGCLIAAGSSNNGGSNYRYSFNCPHCNAKNAIDSYGRYNCYSCYDIFCDTLRYLYKIASSEGEVSFKASEYLNCAVGVFGITSNDFNSIKGEFVRAVEDKYYKILGCKKGDSKEQIKSQYRKLVKEYHPDKVNNMKVSDAVKETLIDKFKAVQEAYEKVK
ncbi:MAG: J domain-containing protein [Sarcina sp.]